MTEVTNPRFHAYAAAYRMGAEEMFQACQNEDRPENVDLFTGWVSKHWQMWAEERGYVKNGYSYWNLILTNTDHDDFDAWLAEHYPYPVTPTMVSAAWVRGWSLAKMGRQWPHVKIVVPGTLEELDTNVRDGEFTITHTRRSRHENPSKLL